VCVCVQDRRRLRTDIVTTGEDSLHLPLNIKRLLWNAQRRFRREPKGADTHQSTQRSDLDPKEIVSAVQKLSKRLVVVRGQDPVRVRGVGLPRAQAAHDAFYASQLSLEGQQNATTLFCMLLRAMLAARQVIVDHHLTADAFNWLLGEIESRFNQASSVTRASHPTNRLCVVPRPDATRLRRRWSTRERASAPSLRSRLANPPRR
jgi:DNA-directed RNA polymerase II subunit RPB1